MIRSFSLTPTRVVKAKLAELKQVMPIFTKLLIAVAQDGDWLEEVFRPMSSQCAWTRHEMAVYQKCLISMREKPTLLLPNAVYLCDETSGDFKMNVCNVQAGEPYQVQLVHDYQRVNFDEGLESGPFSSVTSTLAAAARLVHGDEAVIAILSKPQTNIALRTLVDVAGVGARLKDVEGIRNVLFVSMEDLAKTTLGSNGDLILGEHRISVIYSRYDFSHPTGVFDPDHELPLVHWASEWETIERMERSSCIMSSSLGSRLATRRRVQYRLSRPGEMERFLPPNEAALLRRMIPDQWSLHGGTLSRSTKPIDEDEAAQLDEARALFESNPHGFVAKNVLRPRTGSDKTQNRDASGGKIIDDHIVLRDILFPSHDNAAAAERRRRHLIMYRRVRPQRHSATLMHEGRVVDLNGNAVSEIATYGAYLADPGDDNGTKLFQPHVKVNRVAGVASRTRMIVGAENTPPHALAQELGYGAVSCCKAVLSLVDR
mmetsp:Transcript_16839/g.34303  ORF Transcript_16839/g.34303 Transcript_16839/m.34303 type:complete len:487 (+) Transcript_16839:87-1547(+)